MANWLNNKVLLVGGIALLLIVVVGAFYLSTYFKGDTQVISTPPVTTTPVVESKPVAVAPTATPPTKAPIASTTKPVIIPTLPPVVDFSSSSERFVISLTGSSTDKIIDSLADQGFITNKMAFRATYLAKGAPTILPGGYKLSKEMSATQIINVLKAAPYMKWIVIPPGLRKEEIAELLAKSLGWSNNQKQKWITTYTTLKFDYIEGVYSPDTYLIPVDEAPLEVASRITAKFNEKFAPYIPQFNAQNVKWTTGLTFASIVQREAANTADMPLIAGILWNRLDRGMMLNVDATLQYVRGDIGKGFWAPITVADKQLDSPYNTYKYKGLPPHPIANPGIAAIEATLNPTKTDCLYYLHDSKRATHCAVTYEEHLDNIEKYLKNQQAN